MSLPRRPLTAFSTIAILPATAPCGASSTSVVNIPDTNGLPASSLADAETLGAAMKHRLDALDKALIATLCQDGRVSLGEAAGRAGASAPTVRSRLRTLTAAGVLRVAGLLNASETSGMTIALVGLTLERFNLDEMVERLAGLDEVNWAAVVTGRYDIVAEVVTTEGMSGLYDFLNVSLQELGGVQSSEMFVVMKATNKWMLLPRAMRSGWEHSEDNGV